MRDALHWTAVQIAAILNGVIPTVWRTMSGLVSLAWFVVQTMAVQGGPVETLPGTEPLTWTEELDIKMMEGAHRFVEQEIGESVKARQKFWSRDLSSPQAYAESVKPNRERFQKMIGVVDERRSAVLEYFGDDKNPALVAENRQAAVYQVRWPVFGHVWGEGLLVRPKRPAAGYVIYLPDADQTPEQALGLAEGVKPESQVAAKLAGANFELIIPVLVNRARHVAEVPWEDRTDQSNRQWIYHQAFHMGRHVIGYEVQKVLACVDWFKRQYGEQAKVAVAGYGEGGLIALYAAAVDARIEATLVSGYFGPREKVWSEPLSRNVFGLLREFGDAEIVSLIAPRSLLVEYSPVPEASGRKGELKTPPFQDVQAEFERLKALTAGLGDFHLVRGEDGSSVEPGSREALDWFGKIFSGAALPAPGKSIGAELVDRRRSFDPAERQRRQIKALEEEVQRLVRQSAAVRDAFFLHKVVPELADRTWNYEYEHPPLPVEKFVTGAERYRRHFHDELIGKFDEAMMHPSPRTRKIYDNRSWVGYDVVLDVYPELFAWGVLLVPKDIQPGERRPVVVCQHGRNGLPKNTIEGDHSAYRNFAARLAERGFVVFAPHHLYRGEDRYRWLDRKANSVKASLFSFLIAQHEQITGWLASLPFVDGDRIAFYGLSFGGQSALQIPPVVQRYALSICSGYFNQNAHKVASTWQVSPTDQRSSFIYSEEWETPYFNLGMTFDHAEMAYLIFPRPFMVERGMHDWVGHDYWVAHEYAKVRWFYTQFGLADRTEIQYFNGGHTIRGEGTFDFLHKHLNWPKPH